MRINTKLDSWWTEFEALNADGTLMVREAVDELRDAIADLKAPPQEIREFLRGETGMNVRRGHYLLARMLWRQAPDALTFAAEMADYYPDGVLPANGHRPEAEVRLGFDPGKAPRRALYTVERDEKRFQFYDRDNALAFFEEHNCDTISYEEAA